MIVVYVKNIILQKELGTFINPNRLKKHINTLQDDHSEISNANNSEISTK